MTPVPCRIAPLPDLARTLPCRAARRLLWQQTLSFYELAGLPIRPNRQEANPPGEMKNQETLTLWLNPLLAADPHDLQKLLMNMQPALLQTESGTPLAWIGSGRVAPTSPCIMATGPVHALRYPWELLDWHEHVLACLPGEVRGHVHRAAVVEGTLRLGEGSCVLPGTVIEGFVSIGSRCRIGPHAYLRGCVSVGDDCVVGHAVELKNCVLGCRTHVAHLSYAGDSLLGEDVNVGGGTILSNYRHDGGEHRMKIGRTLLRSGRTKLGCAIEDHARLGANTSVLPGRIIGEGETTFPGSTVR